MPFDQPEQSYHPLAVAVLTVRLEEYGKPILKPAPAKATKNIVGTAATRGALVAVKDAAGNWQIVPKGTTPSPGGATSPGPFAGTSSADGLTYTTTVIPSQADWEQNGIRTADKLRLTARFVDCPLDPRVIRAAAVEFRLGCYDPATGRGLEPGGNPGDGVGYGGGLNVLAAGYIDARGRQRTNVRFLGFVDEWNVDWDEKGEPRLMLECTDMTRLFIDTPVGAAHAISKDKPIDQAIADFLSAFPAYYGVTVEYRPRGATPPTPKGAFGPAAYVPALGVKHAGGGQKLSVWDYLTEFCGVLGHAVFVDGASVVIQLPRTLYSGAFQGRPDDPFADGGRTLGTGEHLPQRRWIWGRNLSRMKVGRKFTRRAPTNVEVRCFDPVGKQTLVVRFPEAADRLKFALPGSNTTDQKWEVLRVDGIRDKKVLKDVAQSAYEGIGRTELSVELETVNLASFGAASADPDLLDMRVGDTIEVLVDRADDDPGTLNQVELALRAQNRAAAFLKALGFTPEFAAAYAKAFNDGGFLQVFKLRELRAHWSADKGVEFKIHATNYVEARADKPQANEPTPPAPAAGGNNNAGGGKQTVGP